MINNDAPRLACTALLADLAVEFQDVSLADGPANMSVRRIPERAARALLEQDARKRT